MHGANGTLAHYGRSVYGHCLARLAFASNFGTKGNEREKIKSLHKP
jgi:hypothetical protein